MDFDHDIFISYSHLDNEPPFPDDPGWISSFHRAVEVRVGQLLGKKPRIWRDPDLDGNDVFSETLAERVKKAATLICVLSPRYVDSNWCLRELKEFSEAGSSLVVEGAGKARVFKVIKTQLPIERQPPGVQPLLGYEFFRVDPGTRRVRELDVSIDPESKKDYWARLDDLAHDIKDLIENMEGDGVAAAPESAAAVGDNRAVYLAETSLDLRDARDAVKRDLLRRGHTVLPDRSLPLAAEELRAFVDDQLVASRLAIHLVGANYGVIPEGADDSLVAIQNDLAATRAAAGGLKRLIWMPPGLEPRDERQRRYVDELRDDERSYVGSDLLEVDVPLEALKSHAYELLAQIEAGTEAAREKAGSEGSAGGDGGPATIYLICDQRDVEAVRPLDDYLFNQGYEVVLPAFEGDEAKVHEDHVYNLTHSDAFLFYYGVGERQWLRNQMSEMTKSRGYPEKRRELAIAVYLAPPASSDKKSYRTQLTPTVLRAGETFDPAVLRPFINQIEHARA